MTSLDNGAIMTPDNYISLKQAAKLGGYQSPSSLLRAIHRGRLHAVKIGRDWFTTEEWLRDYQEYRVTWKGSKVAN